jgi:hypothetical protein
MKTKLFAALALALLATCPSFATTVYDSTTGPDNNTTYIFSVGPYSQIGDSITLAGTDRLLTSATLRFFNVGDTGKFDATLRFWELGSPVASQFGSDYTTNVSLDSFTAVDVIFSSLNLLVPGNSNNLVFTIAISNRSNDAVDPGLIALTAAPLTDIGSSNASTLIVRIGAQAFSEEPAVAPGEGNLFLRLEATSEVPEPATLSMAAAAMLVLFVARKRSRT